MSRFKKAISSVKLVSSMIRNSALRNLVVKNRNFWTRFGSHTVEGDKVIISEQALGSDYWSLIISISAAILTSAYRAKVIFVVRGHPLPSSIFKIVQRTFFKCDFLYLGRYYDAHGDEIKIRSKELFDTINSVDDILKLRYREIPIGEQVYDSVLKHKHATLWKVDERVLAQIENAVNCIDMLLEILDHNKVVAGIFTHTTGTYHGVAVRTILSKAKPVYLAFGGLKAMYRYNHSLGSRGQLDIHIKIPKTYFSQLIAERRTQLVIEAESYFKKRFGGDINDWDALRAFSPDKKLYKTRSEFFRDFPKLRAERKTVFIMLHAMNDDPHVQRQHIFRDYYDWFADTLKLARGNKNVNWVFKQHPMIKFYPDDANLHGLFDLITTDDHIQYIDETASFNSASIPVLADAVITCAGTAGLEFAAFGVPAIITAKNSYAGFNLCYEPNTKGEYAALLSSIESLRPLQKNECENAKILFYLIYNKLIPGYLTGFFPYMNHDQILALSGADAIRLYVSGLTDDKLPLMEQMRAFVQSGNTDAETELFLKI